MVSNEDERSFLLQENGVDYISGHFNLFYPVGLPKDLYEAVTQKGVDIKQGYLEFDPGMELTRRLGIERKFAVEQVRLRIENESSLYLTLKGAPSDESGRVRPEDEYEGIPKEVFDEFWPHTSELRVHKRRLKMPWFGHVFDVDAYQDRSLLKAEVEALKKSPVQGFTPGELLSRIPAIALELTDIKEYSNLYLAFEQDL